MTRTEPSTSPSDEARLDDMKATLAAFKDQRGEDLLTLSRRQPVLLVFLRHFGCTFCREAAADVGHKRQQIEAQGATPVFVHMGTQAQGTDFLASYQGLGGVRHISDPQQRLYKAFELARGNVYQMFGPKSWTRGFRAGVMDGHWVGMLVGDGWQMPGVFRLEDGVITAEYRHKTAADRPDYLALVQAPTSG